MKRGIIGLLALVILSWPVLARAQSASEDRQNPQQYSDVDDGQVLKVVSYILTPFGMALEWGLTRPLHSLATNSSIAPLLSGDTEPSYFGQGNNADQLPPGTFGPYTISGPYTANPTRMSTAPASAPAVPPGYPNRPQVQMQPPAAAQPSGQPVIH